MGSLADCVLADAILNPPHPPILPTNLKKVRGLQKIIETSNRKKHVLVNEKNEISLLRLITRKFDAYLPPPHTHTRPIILLLACVCSTVTIKIDVRSDKRKQQKSTS